MRALAVGRDERVAAFDRIELAQERARVMVNGVRDAPLDVADPDGRARELGCERIDLDPVEDFRPDARHDHAEADRLAIEDRAPLDILDALQRKIKKMAIIRLAVLICVFVIGVLVDEKPNPNGASWNERICWDDRQYSTEVSNSDAPSSITITDISNTVQFIGTLGNSGSLHFCNDSSVRQWWQFGIETWLHWLSCASDTSVYIYTPRNALRSVGNDKPYSDFLQYGRNRPNIYANNINCDRAIIPDTAVGPNVFNANFWTMSGIKFVASQVNGLLQEAALISCRPRQCPSERSNCDGCSGAGENAIEIPIFSNVPKPSDRYVVGGAIIVGSILAIFAYFVIEWSK
jgi:hypothetical protein